jgi:outer membrane lipoprotein carrier protein
VASFLLLLGLLSGAPDSRKAVLDSLSKSGRELQTMTAEFQQTKVNVILNESEESRGKVQLKIPGKVRWDYLSPQPGVMLLAHGQFQRYFPQTKQVFRGNVKGEADLLLGFGPGATKLDEKYDVNLAADELVSGRATYVLDLVPKKAQAEASLFSKIRLWVDKERSIPSQIRLTEPTSDYTTILFDKVHVNGPLKDDAFELKTPPGTEVVQ